MQQRGLEQVQPIPQCRYRLRHETPAAQVGKERDQRKGKVGVADLPLEVGFLLMPAQARRVILVEDKVADEMSTPTAATTARAMTSSAALLFPLKNS
jgi:hypothetical protein